MAAGSYLLIKFDNRQKLVEAVKTLEQFNQISKWDAVDGFFSLVIKVDNDVQPVINALKDFDSSLNYSLCDIQSNNTKAVEFPEEYSQSYLFIEADLNKKENIMNFLNHSNDISLLQDTQGSYDIVAVITAANFDKIDRNVEENIKTLDGILRLKQDRIIVLDKM